jgi:streptogramin lyase
MLKRAGATWPRLSAVLLAVAVPFAAPVVAARAVPTVPMPPEYVTTFQNGFVGESTAIGPEGEIWGTDWSAGQIDRMSTGGILTRRFDVKTGTNSDEPTVAHPSGIIRGADGAMWFIDGENAAGEPLIGRITPAGGETAFPVAAASAHVEDIAVGPEGNVWFTVPYGGTEPLIGRLQPNGAVQHFSITTGASPNLPTFSEPSQIVDGPDGNLWFVDQGANEEGHTLVGRISPIGVITEFPIPQPHNTVGAIAVGQDGNIWVEDAGAWIYRLTPAGALTSFAFPPEGFWSGRDMVTAPDGNFWFTYANFQNEAELGRLSTSGEARIFTGVPEASGAALVGPDGALWYPANGGGAVRVELPLSPRASAAPTVSGPTQVGDTLAASPGQWSGAPTRFAYQWLLCRAGGADCEQIPGANGTTVALSSAMLGSTLRVEVTAANIAGDATLTSTPSSVVTAPPPPPPRPRIESLPEITAALAWRVAHEGRSTLVTSMVLTGLPANGIVVITCSGHGCPFATHTLAFPPRARSRCHPRERCKRHGFTGELNITGLLSGRRLAAGTRVAIAVVKPSTIGKSFRLTMRAGQRPKLRIGCLAVNSRTRAEQC